MRNNSYRNQISTSAFTLPITAGLTVLFWILPSVTDIGLWLGLGVVGLATFLLIELTNSNALLRIRTRMVSSIFLASYMVCPALHHWSTDMIPMICLILSYFKLFATYQQPHPESNVFSGFLFLGLASCFYPPLLFCALVLYLCLLIPLRALTWRTWFAGLFGLILPYWFYAGWAIWKENIDTAFIPFVQSFHFQMADLSEISTVTLSTACLLILIVLCSIFHFSHTAYNDKIRTRMYFYVIISVEVFLLFALLLQPQHAGILLGLLFANSAPLIAHYFALGKGKILDYWFLLCLFLWGTLTIINSFDLWTHLSNFL